MYYKLTILLIFISITTSIQGQNRTSEALTLKDKQHYSERDVLLMSTTPALIQELCYNKPYVIDEEHCIILKLVILDTTKARQLQTIDVVKDSSVVKLSWDIRSVWNWADEKITVTGSIKVLDLTKQSMTISLDICIYDIRHDWTYIYEGNRTFVKSKKKKTNEWAYAND